MGDLPPAPGEAIPGVEGSPLVARVLAARGLSSPAAAAVFLDPRLSQLHDPSLIPDMDRAAERLLAAVQSGEPVVIYGDYDVDGITASAILFHTLKAVAPEAPVSTYVPHRLDEGYGLNTEAIGELAAAGAKVIVSVDCGVTALAPAQAARDLGVDLVITDHHNPPATMDALPRAFAVVYLATWKHQKVAVKKLKEEDLGMCAAFRSQTGTTPGPSPSPLPIPPLSPGPLLPIPTLPPPSPLAGVRGITPGKIWNM